MSPAGLIYNARVATADGSEAAWVRFDDGRISEVGGGSPPHLPGDFRPGSPRSDSPRSDSPTAPAETSIDARGGWLLPGFIDVHVHGCDGWSVMDATTGAVTGMARALVRHGVTSFVPSTVTSPPEELAAATHAVASVTGPVDAGATVLGAHLEGPWISDRFRGAHPPHLLRSPDHGEVSSLLGSGAVRSVTLAPELPDAGWLVDEILGAGAVVVIGHTDATAAQVHAAADGGATHVTHLFNGMRGFHHREPGAVGGALVDQRLSCEVVADGTHVADDALRLARRALGADRMVLVTDATAAAGLGDGDYELAGRRIRVEGPWSTLEDGTIAGSVTTMDQAFARLCEVLDESPLTLWPVVSRNPARVMGIGDRTGEIGVGRRADMVLLDDGLRVRSTFVAGREVAAA